MICFHSLLSYFWLQPSLSILSPRARCSILGESIGWGSPPSCPLCKGPIPPVLLFVSSWEPSLTASFGRSQPEAGNVSCGQSFLSLTETFPSTAATPYGFCRRLCVFYCYFNQTSPGVFALSTFFPPCGTSLEGAKVVSRVNLPLTVTSLQCPLFCDAKRACNFARDSFMPQTFFLFPYSIYSASRRFLSNGSPF